jgi:hypothetical protein
MAEYLTAEILGTYNVLLVLQLSRCHPRLTCPLHGPELAGNASRDNKMVRINPRHIQLAVRNDEELNKLLKNVVIVGTLPILQTLVWPLSLLMFSARWNGVVLGGGILPNIHSVLIPRAPMSFNEPVEVTQEY